MLRVLMLDNDFCLYYYFKYAFKLLSRIIYSLIV